MAARVGAPPTLTTALGKMAIAGQAQLGEADRRLKDTAAVVVDVPAEERQSPCIISDEQKAPLASIRIDDFLAKYARSTETSTGAE